MVGLLFGAAGVAGSMTKPIKYPRGAFRDVTRLYRVRYWDCGACSAMHKTRETAAVCTARAERRREKLAAPKSSKPFTKAMARQALEVVQCDADALALEKKWKCPLSGIISAVVEGRFYLARMKANDGVVRRETSLLDLGFTEEALGQINARELVNVGNLLFRFRSGGLYIPGLLATKHFYHVEKWLGHYPFVKPGFIE